MAPTALPPSVCLPHPRLRAAHWTFRGLGTADAGCPAVAAPAYFPRSGPMSLCRDSLLVGPPAWAPRRCPPNRTELCHWVPCGDADIGFAGAPPPLGPVAPLDRQSPEVNFRSPSTCLDFLPCFVVPQGCIRRGGEGGWGGVWLGPPLLPGSPHGPRRRGAKKFEASILLAPNAPKQNSGCQPQTLEGEEGGPGGGTPPPPTVYGRSNTSLLGPWMAGVLEPLCPHMARWTVRVRQPS